VAKIIAPNKQYDGVSAGVKFEKGVGHTDKPYLIEWFKGHGYTVEKDEPKAKDPEPVEEVTEESIEPEEETKKKPGRKPKHQEGE
jgi:hypothetical protein